MKKIIFVFLTSIFIAGCVSKSDYDSALDEISTLKEEITESESTVQGLQDEVESLLDETNTLQSEYEVLQSDFEELVEEKDLLSDDYISAITELTIAEGTLSRQICDLQIDDMVYENIYDVSTILAGWWVKQAGVYSVQGTYRDHIWSNADTKIHTVRFTSEDDYNPYVEHFLVFFEEFGWNEGIFWLSGQCWLDSPFD